MLLALDGCNQPSIDQLPSQPPTQRVGAVVKLYLGKPHSQTGIDTVLFNGVIYPVNAIDSTSFAYDNQQRLIRQQLSQTYEANGRKLTSMAPLTMYRYQDGYLQVLRDGYASKFPLDSTRQRVTSYTRPSYSFVDVDTLRSYSGEGILVRALQASYNTSYPSINYFRPNRKVALEAGNMIRLETYSSYTGALESVTRFIYDNKHFAPLAALTFLGETSRNVLLRKTEINYLGDVVAYTAEYVYTNHYDQQGRLVSQLEYAETKNASYAGSYTLTRYYY
ncbi:hypothetical protein [Spirosoma gilvum]